MDRFAGDGEAPSSSVFEGWNIGAVSVKRVRLHDDGKVEADTLLASGAFDGYVNMGAFNCAPANTASAVIHALSPRTDTPYLVIEPDGDCIMTGQLRQLETVAVWCRRRREGLNERVSA